MAFVVFMTKVKLRCICHTGIMTCACQNWPSRFKTNGRATESIAASWNQMRRRRFALKESVFMLAEVLPIIKSRKAVTEGTHGWSAFSVDRSRLPRRLATSNSSGRLQPCRPPDIGTTLFLFRFNSVSKSFDSTQLMTHSDFKRIESNQITTQKASRIFWFESILDSISPGFWFKSAHD